MSYPRTIQTLIIEDEPEMIVTYQRYFEKFIRDGLDVAMPTIVGGYQNAVLSLDLPRIYHLVILDLKLPEVAGEDAEGGSVRGLELVGRVAARDKYPVPVLLIVTGEPKRVGNFPSLGEQLQQNFFYGQVIKKNVDLAQDILQQGLMKAWQYSDFGIRVVDEQEEPRPPLTPREEDLIRRASLSNETVKGVDLTWWSAEKNDRGALGELPQWVKVLQGRYILQGQDGLSRPRFFKLESLENGRRAYQSAKRMENMLQHVRVLGYRVGGTRSLLITDKAGPSNEAPMSLNDFLKLRPEVVSTAAQRLAREIAEQLRECGSAQKSPKTFASLLWPHHERERLDSAWTSFCRDEAESETLSPGTLYEKLSSVTGITWVEVRACGHGDLHLGNVSLDFNDGVFPQAFIIDAGPMSPSVCGRDIATLEISLLLHQRYEGSLSLVSACTSFYEVSESNGMKTGHDELPDHHRNTASLIAAIREEALKDVGQQVYTLLLLDEVLIQLGSLSYGTSHNKVMRAYDAVELYRLLARRVIRGMAANAGKTA